MWGSEPKTHALAQLACTGLGGALAGFDSYEEQRAAERYFTGTGQWHHLQAQLWWARWLAPTRGAGARCCKGTYARVVPEAVWTPLPLLVPHSALIHLPQPSP